jgi:hypothetical protein
MTIICAKSKSVNQNLLLLTSIPNGQAAKILRELKLKAEKPGLRRG